MFIDQFCRVSVSINKKNVTLTMVCALCWLQKTTVTNKTRRIFFCGEPYIDIAQISGKLANPATRYYL